MRRATATEEPGRALVLGALAAAMAAGAALRFPFLGNQSLAYDETFTKTIVASASLGDVWHGIERTEATPPVYYVLSWAWVQLTGDHSDAALRATSAIASVLAVPASFVAARRLAGTWVGIATAVLCATSPVLVSFALTARAYSLLVLVSALSVWALARVLERPDRRRLAVWALLAAACLWTHYFAVFLVGAEVAVMLWRLPEARVQIAAATLGAAVLLAPLIPLVAEQNDERNSNIGKLSLYDRFEQTVRQLAAGPNPPWALIEAVAIALAAGGLVAAALAGRRRGVDRATPAAIAGLSLGVPLLLAVVDIQDRFFLRNELIAWTCLAILMAIGLVRMRAIPLAVYAVVCVAIVLGVQGDWRYQNPDWRGATSAVGPRAAGRPIVVYPGLSAAIANTYLEDRGVTPGPVRAREVWVMVEPSRTDRRDLRPTRGYPPNGVPGFRLVEERRHRAFRLLRYEASRPTPLAAAPLGPDVLGGPPAILTR